MKLVRPRHTYTYAVKKITSKTEKYKIEKAEKDRVVTCILI